MPRMTVAGHPLHAVVSDWPVALLSTTPVFDALYLTTGKRSYAETAKNMQVGGFFASLLAAVAGAMDYVTISDRNRELKKTANMHAIINIGIVGLTATSIFLRQRRQTGSGKLPFFLSAVSGLGLMASGWYGGEMIYKYGMRVAGVSPVEDSPELKIPGDERVSRALDQFASVAAPAPMSGSTSAPSSERYAYSDSPSLRH